MQHELLQLLQLRRESGAHEDALHGPRAAAPAVVPSLAAGARRQRRGDRAHVVAVAEGQHEIRLVHHEALEHASAASAASASVSAQGEGAAADVEVGARGCGHDDVGPAAEEHLLAPDHRRLARLLPARFPAAAAAPVAAAVAAGARERKVTTSEQ